MARINQIGRPRNWEKFQHYKNRKPPWIKLHHDLIDDREYQRLPIASRALAPQLWLLASESKDGSFDISIEEIAFRLRQPAKEIEAGLQPLIDSGFFIIDGVDSNLLARCQHVAMPEEEEEEEPDTGFAVFRSIHPKQSAKTTAPKASLLEDIKRRKRELTGKTMAISTSRSATTTPLLKATT
jgi:hypothetical protein